MRAMTCRAMLVTLLLVATAASCHGARRGRLADLIKARQLDEGPTDDVTASSVSIPTSSVPTDDDEQQSTNAPEQEVEARPRPKISLMQRTRDMVSRRRAQSNYRTGNRPTRNRLTPRPRITIRRKPTTSTTTLVPITTSTAQPSTVLTTQTTTLPTTQMTTTFTEVASKPPIQITEIEDNNQEIEDNSQGIEDDSQEIQTTEETHQLNAGPTTDDVTSSSVSMPTSSVPTDDEEQQSTNAPEQELEPVVDQEKPRVKPRTRPKNSFAQRTRDMASRRRAQSRYRTGSRPTRTYLTQGLRTTTQRIRWKPTSAVQPTTTSTTTLLPITKPTTQPSSILTNQNTTIPTTQMTTKSTEVPSNPSVAQSHHRIGSRPNRIHQTQGILTTTQRTRWKPPTAVQPTTTSTTTLLPITTSNTQPSSILTKQITTIPTTQMTTTSTEVASNPSVAQSRYRPGSRPHGMHLTQGLRTTTRWKPVATARPNRIRLTQGLRTTTRWRPFGIVQPTTTSTTTLLPITTPTTQPSSILTKQNTTIPTTQMTTTSTEVLSNPSVAQSRYRIGSRPNRIHLTQGLRTTTRWEPVATVQPKTTSTTTSLPITTSYTQPSSKLTKQTTTIPTAKITTTSTEVDSTHPTEMTESTLFTTVTPLQIMLNKPNTYNNDSLTTTTTRSTTTTTASFPTTEANSQEIQTTEANSQEFQTTEEAGHAGEVFLVEEEDIPNLKIPKPLKPLIPKPVMVGSGLTIGVGLNIADPEDGLERLGPVLVIGNSLRRRRQHHGENNITDETEGSATDVPVETTINPFNDGIEENDYHTDFETTLGPILFNRRTSSTASPTTPGVSAQNLTDASDTTIEANSEAASNVADGIVSNVASFSDFQEVTVGTKVNLGGHKNTLVTGEVIPVELENKSQFEKEHKSESGIELNSESEGDQITPVSDRPERPGISSILGSVLNYFTQPRPERPERPERPRPERPQLSRPDRPVIRPGERPEFRPFRPRPRPTNSRPDILPPRLSLRPTAVEPSSDSTTNRPVDTTIVPEDSPVDELPSRSTQSPIRVFRPRPTGLLNKPSRRPGILPSKPIIESGFQGIRDESGDSRPAGFFRPGAGAGELNDYDYDTDALPPSLPNLKIIPFVAADALTNQQGQQGSNIDSFAGDDFRISPQEEAVTTTTEPTSRRPLAPGTRRPPILPPRRPLRPDGTGRPSAFRQKPPRPGARPSFIPSRTTPTRERITSEENSIAPSTTPSSLSSRLRFTSRKPFTPFMLVPVERVPVERVPVEKVPVERVPVERVPVENIPVEKTTTTELVQSEPEEEITVLEITTDDLPSIESNTVNTPEAPIRLPDPIITSSQSSSSSSSSSKPIKTDDIANISLQDIFGQPEGTKRPPVRFIPASSKPITPTKTPTLLPAIPSLITNLFPLAPDPVVAQGLLKLSGCNIYGRMYNVDDRISELSAECKECRCTPVGVQCLPVCA